MLLVTLVLLAISRLTLPIGQCAQRRLGTQSCFVRPALHHNLLQGLGYGGIAQQGLAPWGEHSELFDGLGKVLEGTERSRATSELQQITMA